MTNFTKEKTHVISARLSQEKIDKLTAFMESRHLCKSEMIRILINHFLTGRILLP